MEDETTAASFGFVVEGVEEGFRLGVKRDTKPLSKSAPLPPAAKQVKAGDALRMRELTEKYLAKERAAGRISEKLRREDVERIVGGPFQVLPFGIVERVGKEPRFVRNFSFPYDLRTSGVDYPSVNARIDEFDEHPSTFWCGPGEFAATLSKLPYNNDYVALVDDAKAAFRLVPIAPDDRRWTVMEHDGGFYLDYCLPMGISSATNVWGRIADVVRVTGEDVLRRKFREHGGDIIFVRNWVDDFVVLAKLGSLLPDEATQLVDEHYAKIGVTLAGEKRRPWSRILRFQGFDWDLARHSVAIPDEKRIKAVQKLLDFSARPLVDGAAVSSVAGTLTHLAFAIPLARGHLPPVHSFAALFDKKPLLALPIPPDVRKELDWWLARLGPVDRPPPAALQRSFLVPTQAFEHVLWTDASDTGLGVVIGDEEYYWRTKRGWRDDGSNIHLPEAAALELAVRIVIDKQPMLVDMVIHALVDNDVVVKAWSSHRSRAPALNLIISRIDRFLHERGCTMIVKYIPSALNKADSTSRGQPPREGRSRAMPAWDFVPPPAELSKLVVFSEYEQQRAV